MKSRRSRVLAGLVVALAIAVATLVVRDRGGDRLKPRHGEVADIDAQATLAPRVVLFGDTVRAQIDVVLDTSRIDPGSVRVAADPAPFELVDRSDTTREASGDMVELRTTLVLRCATANCVPGGQSARYEFTPARISFAAAAGQVVDESPITARMPSIRVYSRFAALSSSTDRGDAPWQADLLSLPVVSYRVDPSVLVALLLAAAALIASAGLTLAYVAWPRRVPTAAPEPKPVLAPVPVLSPLEQALALLETSIHDDGVPAQRRALELVAEELEHAVWGDQVLARAARALAWSEELPDLDETSRLAARVRTALSREDGRAGEEDGGAA